MRHDVPETTPRPLSPRVDWERNHHLHAVAWSGWTSSMNNKLAVLDLPEEGLRSCSNRVSRKEATASKDHTCNDLDRSTNGGPAPVSDTSE